MRAMELSRARITGVAFDCATGLYSALLIGILLGIRMGQVTPRTTPASAPRDRLYVDSAATTALRPEAAAAMEATADLLNPAGQYATGRRARQVLEESREQIAELLGADPVEVIFTGSGTEADNLGVQGLAFAARRTRPDAKKILAPAIEHPAVGETVAWLCDANAFPGSVLGFEHRVMTVDDQGRVSPDNPELAAATSMDTALMALMWANNETGAIQPVDTLVAQAHDKGITTHVDAVQVVGHEVIDFHGLGTDTLAASGHKFGGPRGAGLLLARRDAQLVSPLRGGGQERGIRSGTVNVQAAAGMAAALATSLSKLEEERSHTREVRDLVRDAALSIPDVRIWTTEPALPSHLHMSFPGAEGDSLIMLLDAAGTDASTGSACSAGVNRASHVLTAMGVPVEVARGALRLTFGPQVSREQAWELAERLPRVVEQARAAGMAY